MPHPLTRWIEDTLTHMVPRPGELRIEETVSTYAILVRITPGNGNDGFVLGRDGRAINALRELATRMGDQQDLIVSISVKTPRKLRVSLGVASSS